MHALPAQLIEFFRDTVAEGRDAAVVTVVSTAGSTYTKAGTHMLVDADANYYGMVSGGCLEGDLAEHARAAISDGEERFVDYDLASDDELFGLGVGCEGSMRLQIRPLLAASGWEPFASLIDRLEAGEDCSEEGVRGPHRVRIVGNGADVKPLVDICTTLGWRVEVVDHEAEHDDSIEAAIVMTHNTRKDRECLARLADSAVPFVGLLGPPQRRDRLLGELGDKAQKLEGRLHAPVGKPIGGRGPAAIALEIAAELQAWFAVH